MLSVLAPAVAAAHILMAVLVWQQKAMPGRIDLSLCLSTGAFFFLYKAFPQALAFGLPIVLVAPLIVNRAYRAAFEIPERPLWADAFVAMALLTIGLAAYVWNLTLASGLFTLLSLYVFVELPVLVWRSLPDDLIEARRNARIWVLGLGALLGPLVAIGAALVPGQSAVTFGATASLCLCVAAAAYGRAILATLAPVPSQKAALDAREHQILSRMRIVMRERHLYLDANLTLSRLAQRLDVPEHRLRRVIHLGEGKRNFSAYLNALRIETVKARIESGDTMLDLALSAGYASLSAFNRAFREAEGMTPTAFRAARMAKASARAINSAEADSDAGKA